MITQISSDSSFSAIQMIKEATAESSWSNDQSTTGFYSSPHIHRHWCMSLPLPLLLLLLLFFWHSQPKLPLHLPTWGADSSARQIRDFSASVFPCVCCFCLSGCGLLWWLSNPQALIITWRCLSLTFGSACRQSQVWTRLSEVDAAVLHFYCWLHRRGRGGGV